MNAAVSEPEQREILFTELVQSLAQAKAGRTPQVMRELARRVVELRSRFVWNGLPDWGGRSSDYRNAIYRAYREAGIPSDSVAGLQANLRYHVGNVVREVAPPDQLEAIGLRPEGPRLRAITSRAEAHPRRQPATHQPARPQPVPLVVMRDPLALASFAIDAIRAIRELKPGGATAHALQPLLKQLTEETVDAVAETARRVR